MLIRSTGLSDERMGRILAAAAAAPSSHNSQPWRLRVNSDGVEVWGDASRMLPRSDKDNRQFFISLGCVSENIATAAALEGFSVKVSVYPDPSEPLCAAKISLGEGEGRDGNPPVDAGLAEAIFNRHANRDSYEDRAVPEDFLSFLKNMASSDIAVITIEDKERKAAIAEVVANATEAAFHDKGFTEELSRWIKPSLKRYRDGMPGYNIGIPWPISFIVPLAIRYGNVAKQQRKMVEGPLRATPSYIVIATRDDQPLTWVTSGILLERMWLQATNSKLAMGPVAAAVQIGDFYKDVQSILGTGFRPQVFARLGYPTKTTKPSPRRAPSDLLF